MLYLQKLLDAFPDDAARDRRFRRDMLGPRFLLSVAQDYRIAAELRDADAMRAAAADLAWIARMNRLRVRLIVRGVLPLLRQPWLAARLVPMLMALRPLARRFGGARRTWL